MMFKSRVPRIFLTALFVAMSVMSCGDGDNSDTDSRSDASLTDGGTGDVGQVDGCESNGDAGRADAGATECREGQVFECIDDEWEPTSDVCDGPHANLQIFDDPDLGFVEEGVNGAYISISFKVSNYGDAATENLRCELEVFDRTGESLGTQNVLITTGEIDGPGAERLGDEFGGLDPDAFPSIRLFCTADNEPAPFVDDENEFRAEVRQF